MTLDEMEAGRRTRLEALPPNEAGDPVRGEASPQAADRADLPQRRDARMGRRAMSAPTT